MSLHRFFLDNQVLAAETNEVFPLRLAPDDAKHARVLRLVPGEHVAVVDAASDYFECEIVRIDDAIPIVRIACREDAKTSRPQVILVQGLAKGDKMDSVVRHATELGVAAFVPLACERAIVKLDAKKAASRRERWQAIAKSAAMQSGQPFVPDVAPVATLDQAIELMCEATAVLVCWEEAPGSAAIDEALWEGMKRCACSQVADARVAVVVGPEGGLADREVSRIVEGVKCGFTVSLGPSILRTETAGVVAPALVLYELGCLGARGNR
ncbi:16S rRNA (uracil(1498)-N(3))-methyltransferase [Adlercreutzia sp. ZJ138]|uniref:RsmE family RNA methyltransferase n=1 Tax=Adlercreutzia sp. ZJ138 TaxID=2709405 RepID=UPI0013EB1498|nr:RsmE family RNA methyltransferase [Adlercreutzia sp. ZJ138]